MAKDSKLVYGASGKNERLTFEPENLHLVTGQKHTRFTMSVSTCLSARQWC
ncbi:Uncharacterised protein [Klebsiella pneumoniae]|nr:Uncharacterised protein [Klebsiella pneumoniae]